MKSLTSFAMIWDYPQANMQKIAYVELTLYSQQAWTKKSLHLNFVC